MRFGHIQYFPVTLPILALLAGAIMLVLALVQIRVLRYAYMQLGVSPGGALLLLSGSLLGSYVNIPIAILGQETMLAKLGGDVFRHALCCAEDRFSRCHSRCERWWRRYSDVALDIPLVQKSALGAWHYRHRLCRGYL